MCPNTIFEVLKSAILGLANVRWHTKIFLIQRFIRHPQNVLHQTPRIFWTPLTKKDRGLVQVYSLARGIPIPLQQLRNFMRSLSISFHKQQAVVRKREVVHSRRCRGHLETL
jgi:hypothetical protein